MNWQQALGILVALTITARLSPRQAGSFAKAAPDETKSRDTEESEETTRLIVAELPNWQFWSGATRKTGLKLEPKSVLRWTNPDIGRVNGDIYLWTAAGRPEAVMSLIKSWEPDVGFLAEMQSLSLGGLDVERDGKQIWQPTSPGVELLDVPDAPKPADTPVRRLSQMRAIAAEFSAELTDHRRNNSGLRKPLRLLTQPLYRYQSTSDDLVDGAMFAFVLGTDPEVFLLLEARRSLEGPRWQFGLARMNPDSLAVLHREKEAWSTRRVDRLDGLENPYVLLHVPEAPR